MLTDPQLARVMRNALRPRRRKLLRVLKLVPALRPWKSRQQPWQRIGMSP
jgi:hypothetical protein